MDRLIALLVLSPFALIAVAVLRFYLANPGIRQREPRDYVRDVWRDVE